jgi:hypothetical protein
MGHYDNCRDGYCPKCGAAPGNIINGYCMFCNPKEYKKEKEKKETDHRSLTKKI